MLVLSGAGETDQVLKGSVGKVYPGVDVKLANGDEGDILMKGPTMFDRSVELHHAEQQLMGSTDNKRVRYIDDPKATREVFTDDGYYRTGDIARRAGQYYFILGRASIDSK